MAPKALKALCLLVHFLINVSPGFSQSNTVYRVCCEATTIFAYNSNGQKKGDTKQDTFSQNSLFKGTIDQKKCGQKWNKIEQEMMDPEGNDDGSSEITEIASILFRKTDSKRPKTDKNCWHVEMTNENCNGRQNCKSYAVFSTGVIVGAVLGGAVFGSVITMIVFLCFCRAFLFLKIRNLDCKPRSDKNLQESLRPVDNETVYNEINDQAVIRLQPMGRPESAHVSPREETYSHLHESDKEDMNKSYDHARPVPSCCVRENRYEVLTRVGNNNREGQTTATDDVPSQSDNYFIIEPQ